MMLYYDAATMLIFFILVQILWNQGWSYDSP